MGEAKKCLQGGEREREKYTGRERVKGKGDVRTLLEEEDADPRQRNQALMDTEEGGRCRDISWSSTVKGWRGTAMFAEGLQYFPQKTPPQTNYDYKGSGSGIYGTKV